MSTYQLAQEYKDIRWGTLMPVDVMVGSTYAQVRAFGLVSVRVVDPAQLEAQVPDPADLTRQVPMQVSRAIMDMIGMRSQQVSTVAELTIVTPETVQTLQAMLEPFYSALGLQLTQVSIQSMQTM